MKRLLLTLVFIFFVTTKSTMAVLLINEVSAGSGNDWVELTASDESDVIDISGLFVTTYMGSNERIASSPVTICGRDVANTPYDDRFVVIHFTSSPGGNETDAAGDINGNGIRDIYCRNYSLWNTDGCVAIDTDDNPNNDGMMDFVAYSNRDGSINATIAKYIKAAVSAGQWQQCVDLDLQKCCAWTGGKGMEAGCTLSRIGGSDSNSCSDFIMTRYATPGRPNIINPDRNGRKLFRPGTKTITFRYPGNNPVIPLFIYEQCSLRVRIFNATGMILYSSELARDINPGYFNFTVSRGGFRRQPPTGLYPARIEAVGGDSSTESSTVYIVIVRK